LFAEQKASAGTNYKSRHSTHHCDL